MKTASIARVLALPVALFLSGCITPQRGGRAHVEFINPDGFRDLQASGVTRAESIAKVLPRFRADLEEMARNSIPAGYTVNLRITDIQQAGVMDNTALSPVRVVGVSVPAVVAFDYDVTNAGGNQVTAGSERISRSFNLDNAFINQNAALPTVEFIFQNWMDQLAYQLARTGK